MTAARQALRHATATTRGDCIAAGALGPETAGALDGLRVTLRESPVAFASFEGPLG